MKVYLLRHADAGERDEWDGPDARRPLDEVGWKQAHLLADMLGAQGVARIISSPYDRCAQTVEPLAERLHRSIEENDLLVEGVDGDATVALIRGVDAGSVLCTHGDNVPKVLARLRETDGLPVPEDAPHRKGSIWVLERDEAGRFVGAEYVPPPA